VQRSWPYIGETGVEKPADLGNVEKMWDTSVSRGGGWGLYRTKTQKGGETAAVIKWKKEESRESAKTLLV